ncbi:hypothetical protein D3C76_1756220 [compost metagenome]
MAVRKCRDRNSKMPVQSAITTTNTYGLWTNIGTNSTAAAAPTKVPIARYNALDVVGPRNGLETMYTVAIAQ